VEPNKHTDKRLGGVPEKHAVVPHTKSTRKRSSKTSKIACTFDNPTIYSSSGEPASAYTGVYAGSSGVALATAGNELILAADDIDPRSHPVVRSSQAAFLNQSSSRSGNPSYFSVYGLDADYDSDASSEDFDPFASEPILEFDRGVSNSYFASSFTGNKTSGTNRA
jgi:hypothetical protein